MGENGSMAGLIETLIKGPMAVWVGIDAFALLVIFGRGTFIDSRIGLSTLGDQPVVLGASVLAAIVATSLIIGRVLKAARTTWSQWRARQADDERRQHRRNQAAGLSRALKTLSPAAIYLIAEQRTRRQYPRVDGDPERSAAARELQDAGLARITNGVGRMPHQRFVEIPDEIAELASTELQLPNA